MQSKKEGPGDFWDTTNEISVLCEVKHSRNMASRFYGNSAKDDIVDLSAYPGRAQNRVFLFFDWWPKYRNKSKRYLAHKDRLKRRVLPSIKNPVDIIYVPRKGELERETFFPRKH